MESIQFKDKQIRTIQKDGVVYFSGQDIFNAIGITWRGSNGFKARGGVNFIIEKVNTTGGNQFMVFIDNLAVKEILFRSRFLSDDESIELLSCVGIDCNFAKINVKESVFRKTIKSICEAFYLSCYYQFPILSYKVDIFIPLVGIVEYNEPHHSIKKDTARLLSIKEHTGLDIYICSQGEEFDFYRRLIKELVTISNGIDHKVAAETSKQFAEPLFKKLMELGIDRKELE